MLSIPFDPLWDMYHVVKFWSNWTVRVKSLELFMVVEQPGRILFLGRSLEQIHSQ